MKQAAGTTPRGTADERAASHWVQQMFTGIAPRYDLLNHLLSLNIDRGWRKALVGELSTALDNREAKVLDLCCGTGDVLLELQKAAACRVMGADFCHPMLVTARAKGGRRGIEVPVVEADALDLPFANNSLDAIAIAFGFRNLANYRSGLNELFRVLKPGGVLAILEFSHPQGVAVRLAYGLYSKFMLPAVGRMISGSKEAYAYLPESIRSFPDAESLRRMIESVGFGKTSYRLLSSGIAALHVGRKLSAHSV